MRFLLAFALCFVSVFASAQAPMVLGGPQGIDVTRILARNWMSIPTYTDTPAAPLTGSGWPARGFIIHVAKSGDTAVWQYTGKKWAKIGGAAENNFTFLVSGGQYNKAVSTNNVFVKASTYYIKGLLYSSNQQIVAGFPKTANSSGRIDAIVLGPSGPSIIQGTESANPASPAIPDTRLKIGLIYYPPFDTLPQVTGNELTSVFRKPGRDSLYFTSGDTTIAVKDSIGIAPSDTASMLTNYVNTASNGLTKSGKDVRLGGTLNQATRIALNGNSITIVGSSDSSRFFSNGSLSVGYRNQIPSDDFYKFSVNGMTRFNGVASYTGDLLPGGTPNAYSIGLLQGANYGSIVGYSNNGISPRQQLEFGNYTTSLNTNNILNGVGNNNYGFRIYGGSALPIDSGGGSYTNFRISPSINYNLNFKKAIHMGLSYEPTVQSLNNTTHIAFRNTRGSNLFNVNSGNTLIGYDTTSAAYQVDTTYKLDVNGSARITNGPLLLAQGASSVSNINIKGRASTNIVFETGGGNIVIGDDLIRSSFTQRGTDNILIGRSSAPALVGTLNDYIVGSSNIVIGRSSAPQFTTNAKGNVIIGHYAGKTVGIGQFPIGDSDYKFLLTGGASLLSGAEGYNLLYGDFLTGQLIVNPTNGVDNPTINSSVQFGINSTTKGFLQPRMTNTQINAITTPATGLQLFSTTDSANYVYRGTGGGWQKIANEISGSFTIDFPATNNGTHSDVAVTLTGATAGNVVSIGVPNGSVLNHSCYTAWVSADNQVTVRFNNYGGGNIDPASGTFKIKVFK